MKSVSENARGCDCDQALQRPVKPRQTHCAPAACSIHADMGVGWTIAGGVAVPVGTSGSTHLDALCGVAGGCLAAFPLLAVHRGGAVSDRGNLRSPVRLWNGLPVRQPHGVHSLGRCKENANLLQPSAPVIPVSSIKLPPDNGWQ